MKAVFDRRRTVFVHDFDGVYYNYEDKENFVDFLCECGGMAGAGLLPSLDAASATKIHHDSYFAHGMAHFGFLEIAATHDFKPREFTSAYYRDYHQHVYTRAQTECPGWMNAAASLPQLFARLHGTVQHGLLTQSTLNEWAAPLLRDYKLIEYFNPACLLGFEECDHTLKSVSTKPLELAMTRMNAQPWQTVFIEDSSRNLAKAKELHPDILTVFICGKRPLDALPAHIDIQVDTLERFIQSAIRLHSKPAAAFTL